MDKLIRKAEREGDVERVALLKCRTGKHEFTRWQKAGWLMKTGPDPCSGREGPLEFQVDQKICFWCFRQEFRRSTPQQRWDAEKKEKEEERKRVEAIVALRKREKEENPLPPRRRWSGGLGNNGHRCGAY